MFYVVFFIGLSIFVLNLSSYQNPTVSLPKSDDFVSLDVHRTSMGISIGGEKSEDNAKT